MDQKSRVIMMRLPLTVVSILLNCCSIFGNTVVLHIFRTKYERESNYRLFVLLLASFDIAISIFHVIKEQFRRRLVFFGGVTILCPIINYVRVFHWHGNNVYGTVYRHRTIQENLHSFSISIYSQTVKHYLCCCNSCWRRLEYTYIYNFWYKKPDNWGI